MSNPVDGFAQKIVKSIDGGDVMVTKYVFIAEGIDAEGRRSMYTAATLDLPIWDELGLVEFAKNLCVIKMMGKTGTDD